MNKIRQTGAIVTLSLTLVVSAFAGTIYSPGAVKPPTDPPTTQTTSTTSISTTLILTVLGLIR